MKNLKERIIEIVTEKQGLKATELAAVLGQDPKVFESSTTITDLILELVRERRLVEVEYVLPHLGYRVKSFLLPAESQVRTTAPDIVDF